MRYIRISLLTIIPIAIIGIMTHVVICQAKRAPSTQPKQEIPIPIPYRPDVVPASRVYDYDTYANKLATALANAIGQLHNSTDLQAALQHMQKNIDTLKLFKASWAQSMLGLSPAQQAPLLAQVATINNRFLALGEKTPKKTAAFTALQKICSLIHSRVIPDYALPEDADKALHDLNRINSDFGNTKAGGRDRTSDEPTSRQPQSMAPSVTSFEQLAQVWDALEKLAKWAHTLMHHTAQQPGLLNEITQRATDQEKENGIRSLHKDYAQWKTTTRQLIDAVKEPAFTATLQPLFIDYGHQLLEALQPEIVPSAVGIFYAASLAACSMMAELLHAGFNLVPRNNPQAATQIRPTLVNYVARLQALHQERTITTNDKITSLLDQTGVATNSLFLKALMQEFFDTSTRRMLYYLHNMHNVMTPSSMQWIPYFGKVDTSALLEAIKTYATTPLHQAALWVRKQTIPIANALFGRPEATNYDVEAVIRDLLAATITHEEEPAKQEELQSDKNHQLLIDQAEVLNKVLQNLATTDNHSKVKAIQQIDTYRTQQNSLGQALSTLETHRKRIDQSPLPFTKTHCTTLVHTMQVAYLGLEAARYLVAASRMQAPILPQLMQQEEVDKNELTKWLENIIKLHTAAHNAYDSMPFIKSLASSEEIPLFEQSITTLYKPVWASSVEQRTRIWLMHPVHTLYATYGMLPNQVNGAQDAQVFLMPKLLEACAANIDGLQQELLAAAARLATMAHDKAQEQFEIPEEERIGSGTGGAGVQSQAEKAVAEAAAKILDEKDVKEGEEQEYLHANFSGLAALLDKLGLGAAAIMAARKPTKSTTVIPPGRTKADVQGHKPGPKKPQDKEKISAGTPITSSMKQALQGMANNLKTALDSLVASTKELLESKVEQPLLQAPPRPLLIPAPEQAPQIAPRPPQPLLQAAQQPPLLPTPQPATQIAPRPPQPLLQEPEQKPALPAGPSISSQLEDALIDVHDKITKELENVADLASTLGAELESAQIGRQAAEGLASAGIAALATATATKKVLATIAEQAKDAGEASTEMISRVAQAAHNADLLSKTGAAMMSAGNIVAQGGSIAGQKLGQLSQQTAPLMLEAAQKATALIGTGTEKTIDIAKTVGSEAVQAAVKFTYLAKQFGTRAGQIAVAGAQQARDIGAQATAATQEFFARDVQGTAQTTEQALSRAAQTTGEISTRVQEFGQQALDTLGMTAHETKVALHSVSQKTKELFGTVMQQLIAALASQEQAGQEEAITVVQPPIQPVTPPSSVVSEVPTLLPSTQKEMTGGVEALFGLTIQQQALPLPIKKARPKMRAEEELPPIKQRAEIEVITPSPTEVESPKPEAAELPPFTPSVPILLASTTPQAPKPAAIEKLREGDLAALFKEPTTEVAISSPAAARQYLNSMQNEDLGNPALNIYIKKLLDNLSKPATPSLHRAITKRASDIQRLLEKSTDIDPATKNMLTKALKTTLVSLAPPVPQLTPAQEQKIVPEETSLVPKEQVLMQAPTHVLALPKPQPYLIDPVLHAQYLNATKNLVTALETLPKLEQQPDAQPLVKQLVVATPNLSRQLVRTTVQSVLDPSVIKYIPNRVWDGLIHREHIDITGMEQVNALIQVTKNPALLTDPEHMQALEKIAQEAQDDIIAQQHLVNLVTPPQASALATPPQRALVAVATPEQRTMTGAILHAQGTMAACNIAATALEQSMLLVKPENLTAIQNTPGAAQALQGVLKENLYTVIGTLHASILNSLKHARQTAITKAQRALALPQDLEQQLIKEADNIIITIAGGPEVAAGIKQFFDQPAENCFAALQDPRSNLFIQAVLGRMQTGVNILSAGIKAALQPMRKKTLTLGFVQPSAKQAPATTKPVPSLAQPATLPELDLGAAATQRQVVSVRRQGRPVESDATKIARRFDKLEELMKQKAQLAFGIPPLREVVHDPLSAQFVLDTTTPEIAEQILNKKIATTIKDLKKRIDETPELSPAEKKYINPALIALKNIFPGTTKKNSGLFGAFALSAKKTTAATASKSSEKAGQEKLTLAEEPAIVIQTATDIAGCLGQMAKNKALHKEIEQKIDMVEKVIQKPGELVTGDIDIKSLLKSKLASPEGAKTIKKTPAPEKEFKLPSGPSVKELKQMQKDLNRQQKQLTKQNNALGKHVTNGLGIMGSLYKNLGAGGTPPPRPPVISRPALPSTFGQPHLAQPPIRPPVQFTLPKTSLRIPIG